MLNFRWVRFFFDDGMTFRITGLGGSSVLQSYFIGLGLLTDIGSMVYLPTFS